MPEFGPQWIRHCCQPSAPTDSYCVASVIKFGLSDYLQREYSHFRHLPQLLEDEFGPLLYRHGLQQISLDFRKTPDLTPSLLSSYCFWRESYVEMAPDVLLRIIIMATNYTRSKPSCLLYQRGWRRVFQENLYIFKELKIVIDQILNALLRQLWPKVW